ncbi:testis-expressed protein 44 [Octodon degus]|uniref:Testis-expressed protein 44 n=1 Tax=Octodon degus TaxID=10160 RepID=A0A6P3F2I0_OCTDE|nr:testis-expressed protein 44 [Octodon degus]
MTTGPPGEAEATSSVPHGPPGASDRAGDTPTEGSQSQDPLPADASTADGSAGSQDVEHEPKPPSGDKDRNAAAGGSSPEEPEEVSPLPQEPRGEQPSEDARAPSSAASSGAPPAQEEKTREASAAPGQAEAAPDPATQGAAAPATAQAPAVPGPARDAAGATTAASPASDVGPARGFPRSQPLDPAHYAAAEETDYMRSVTSLLGAGESAIGPLADVLAWPEATVGMGLALGLLATAHGSPADLLSAEGPDLRSISSILGGASFSAWLREGTGSALRSLTRALVSVERSTREGLRSALRYLAGNLCPRGAAAAPGAG